MDDRTAFLDSKVFFCTYMTYSDKLKDPRWQKMRLEILERDDFTCQLCNDTQTELHVHHFIYSKNGNPWDVSQHALTTYCKHCHAVVEYDKTGKYTTFQVFKISLVDDNIQMFVFNLEDEDVDIYKYDEKHNTIKYAATVSDRSIKMLFEYIKSREDFNTNYQILINKNANA